MFPYSGVDVLDAAWPISWRGLHEVFPFIRYIQVSQWQEEGRVQHGLNPEHLQSNGPPLSVRLSGTVRCSRGLGSTVYPGPF